MADIHSRYAIVYTLSYTTAQAYLPRNYEIIGPIRDKKGDRIGWLITGHDEAGWTMSDYIIPRYASGMHRCVEIGLTEEQSTNG